jgi:hypothetical protein
MNAVRWEGDNLPAIERLVAPYGSVRYENHGAKSLMIVAKEFAREGEIEALQESAIVVNLGDTIRYEPGTDGLTDRIGVERLPNAGPPEEVRWTGGNWFEIARFVQQNDVRVNVEGFDLALHTPGRDTVRMRRGDKLLKRGGKLFMSRAGKDHRA